MTALVYAAVAMMATVALLAMVMHRGRADSEPPSLAAVDRLIREDEKPRAARMYRALTGVNVDEARAFVAARARALAAAEE